MMIRWLLVVMLIVYAAHHVALAAGPKNTPVDLSRYAKVIYVSADAGNDRNDGSRGAPVAGIDKALQLTEGATADAKAAILVAAGTYPSAELAMRPHVDLFGGYSPDFTRDVHRHRSIIDGAQKYRCIVAADHASIDGFVIQNGADHRGGAGILCDRASPTISNNVIIHNTARTPQDYVFGLLHQVGSDGGAIAVVNGARPTIENNLIAANRTEMGGGAGIGVRNLSLPEIRGNVFLDNITGTADTDADVKKRARSSNGGAISLSNALPDGDTRARIEENLFFGNIVGGNSDAGAIYGEYDSSPVIDRNVMLANAGQDDGGAMYFMKASHPLITRNIIAGNTGGGAIRLSKEGRATLDDNLLFANNTGEIICADSWMHLTHTSVLDSEGAGLAYVNARYPHIRTSIVASSLFHGNSNPALRVEAKEPLDITASAMQTTLPGEGNITAAPMFEDDQRELTVPTAAFDGLAGQTRLSSTETIANAKELPGRIVRRGDRWGVIASASDSELVIWGDLTAAEGPLTIVKTYTQTASSPARGAGARITAVAPFAVVDSVKP